MIENEWMNKWMYFRILCMIIMNLNLLLLLVVDLFLSGIYLVLVVWYRGWDDGCGVVGDGL